RAARRALARTRGPACGRPGGRPAARLARPRHAGGRPGGSLSRHPLRGGRRARAHRRRPGGAGSGAPRMLSGAPMPRPRHETIPRALAAAAQSAIGLTFVDAQERERALPFAEMHRRARQAAGALRERGVRRGDRVAIVLPTGVEFMDAFFGALFAGAVPVPLYPPVRLARLDEFHQRTARMLAATGARIVLSDARISRLLGVAVSQARPELGLRPVELGEELEEPSTPDDLALIQFSSGT